MIARSPVAPTAVSYTHLDVYKRQAYEDGIITGILTTNLIYQSPELLSKPYYINCDMSKYIALLIDTLNHDGSISTLLNPNERIQHVLQEYRNR